MSAELEPPEKPRRTPPRKPPTAEAPDRSAIPAPPKLQRRPILAAVAIIAIATGSLLVAYLVTVAGDSRGVVAVRTDIERGSVIERANLVEARINPDPALATVPIEQIDSIVGREAAVDLHAGGLISPESVTNTVLPQTGQAIVGIALTPGQRPSNPLRAGDVVRIIFTPRPQDELPRGTPPNLAATVVAVRDIPDGNQVVVDVSITAGKAPQLAALAGTNRVALVLDRKP